MAIDWAERLERVKMALAESGFPEEAKECSVGPAASNPNELTIFMPPEVPLAIIWQTAKVTGGVEDSIACWSCFEATRKYRDRSITVDCMSGRCRNPGGDKEPPRELLQQVSNRQPTR
jgi:hypothetical protein